MKHSVFLYDLFRNELPIIINTNQLENLREFLCLGEQALLLLCGFDTHAFIFLGFSNFSFVEVKKEISYQGIFKRSYI
jgi:hypothetical protein